MSELYAVFSIDSNIILRYILKDHIELSPKAARIFDAIEAGEALAYLDPVNLAEVVWVLHSFYKATQEEIHDYVRPIVQMEGIRMPAKDRYILALELFSRARDHFGDACACAAALLSCNGRLCSFDVALSKVDGITRLETLPNPS